MGNAPAAACCAQATPSENQSEVEADDVKLVAATSGFAVQAVQSMQEIQDKTLDVQIEDTKADKLSTAENTEDVMLAAAAGTDEAVPVQEIAATDVQIEDAKAGELLPESTEDILFGAAAGTVEAGYGRVASITSADAEVALAAVTEAAGPQPELVVVITQKGNDVSISFKQRPLGMGMAPAPPSACCAAAPESKVVVTRLDATKENLKEAKVGMFFKSIQGKDVNAMEWTDIKALMLTEAKKLPVA